MGIHTVVFSLLKEVLMSMIAKIAFRTVAERFMTRLVIYGLEKLMTYSTNDVVKGTVEDIMRQLRGKKLKVVDDIQKEKIENLFKEK